MRIKKTPIWVEHSKVDEAKALLRKQGLYVWNEVEALYFHPLTAVATAIGAIVIVTIIALLN